jgi:hypothetical protein
VLRFLLREAPSLDEAGSLSENLTKAESWTKNSVKGQCHEIFDPWFFSLNYPPYGPDSRAKAVSNMPSNLPKNSRKLFEMVGFCGLNVTAETASAVTMTSWKQIPWFQWDCRSGFRGFNVTAEAASAVSMRPLNPYKDNIIFFCQIGSFQHKTMSEKFGFRGFNDTVEVDSVVSMRPRKWFQRFQWDRRSGFGGFNETAEVDSAVSMRPRNPFKGILQQKQIHM